MKKFIRVYAENELADCVAFLVNVDSITKIEELPGSDKARVFMGEDSLKTEESFSEIERMIDE